ncbi:hypothetical protein DFP72DRAFT_354053 [Ephemerocybe angulata]|uniref:Uncharacterized protein n=1 Tax=Ephemerocybe angulata TaxID=980116 RepID=A0A8H6HXP3_9AGAR|nr:hypothetical protein DFP72DRAFT_354053 [Tulosesus angulatus]
MPCIARRGSLPLFVPHGQPNNRLSPSAHSPPLPACQIARLAHPSIRLSTRQAHPFDVFTTHPAAITHENPPLCTLKLTQRDALSNPSKLATKAPGAKLGSSSTKTHTTSSSRAPNSTRRRVVDPTPPQHPCTMAVRRTSAVAGLTATQE